ncbi:ABC transporter permease [Paenibacillus sp. IB182496]|uniref:Cell division protein FtsX n=1 Tax=Paenibacillus sabuli TaxID=2772509 RepID=A0A927BQA6_9BACL|nr:permease-like cell division protein FtsX [Paenibacillus sabuli]MBD2844767.1 ABC transporter permease [Paenibacillus sabuli]
MRFSTLLRHIREGFKSLLRNGWMTFASVSSICISLFILGVFLFLALNVNSLADQIKSTVQVRAFLQLNMEQTEIDALRNRIGSIEEVSSITFVSKEEGLELLRESLGEDGQGLLEGFDEVNNPLPDAFNIEAVDPELVPEIARKIEAINTPDEQPIYSVKYGQGTVESLFKVMETVRWFGLGLVGLLALTAMFLIANTIKTTIIARRREIGIMKLVGATNTFIRWPFFIEGVLIGLIGSGITTGILIAGYAQLVKVSQFELGLMMIRLVTLQESWLIVAVLLITMGTLIGVWGSTISIRKYLKV